MADNGDGAGEEVRVSVRVTRASISVELASADGDVWVRVLQDENPHRVRVVVKAGSTSCPGTFPVDELESFAEIIKQVCAQVRERVAEDARSR